MTAWTFLPESSPERMLPLRNACLDACPEAQELYLELKIRTASAYLVQRDGQTIGYFFRGSDGALLEYFLLPEFIDHADTVFGEILQQGLIQAALCKSFDHTLLSCCMSFHKRVHVGGILCREWRDRECPRLDGTVRVRLADLGDVPHLIAINDGVFDHPEDVLEYTRGEQILLFERGDDLIGFGLFSRVIPARLEFDIGMQVVPEQRGLGYGTAIIRHMADHCRSRGWRPICGCDAANVASRRCLEKAGFIARYRLLAFGF